MNQALNINYFWTQLLIEELVRHGCSHFAIAPGSRSTPLVGAVKDNKKTSLTLSFDERSLGFYALGFAKATGMPAPIIVTSGTAIANLMPAVVEASLDRVPMIIISADRPVELLDVGANQTIFQNNFFGSYARWFFDLPGPDERTTPKTVLSMAAYAVFKSRASLPGPVHLNCHYREPLVPIKEPFMIKDDLSCYLDSQEPFTRYEGFKKILDHESLVRLATLLKDAERGLIVLGHINNKQVQDALLAFFDHIAWPVIPDIASGFRQHEMYGLKYEPYLWQHPFIKEKKFDVVLQIGGRLISKQLQSMLLDHCERQILLDDHEQRYDPNLGVNDRFIAEIDYTVRELLKIIPKKNPTSFLPNLKAIAKVKEPLVQALLEQGEEINEPFVARHISQKVLSDSMLLVANSMPIRDYHNFAETRADGGPTIVVNRGASGIDGLISTALGFSYGTRKRGTMIIGDLAFMHDANALSLLKKHPYPLCIVVINNQGGGIFSFLPIVSFPDILTPLIDSEHDHDLAGFSKSFGIRHEVVTTKKAFKQIFAQCQESHAHSIIEIKTERKSNFHLHEQIKEACLKSN